MKSLFFILRSIFQKPKVYFVAFWIGQKCSLKCRLCCNLIPYMKQKSYNADELIKDFIFLAQNSRIEFLQIQGGEPFTHPNIVKIIDSVGKFVNNSGGG